MFGSRIKVFVGTFTVANQPMLHRSHTSSTDLTFR